MMRSDDFAVQNTKDWASVHTSVFGDIIPFSAEWRNLDDIISILGKIGKEKWTAYMLFPRVGGMDITGAEQSNEIDTIDLLTTGSTYRIKPLKLTFENVDPDQDWNYFRLETSSLLPIDKDQNPSDKIEAEDVVELSEGHYLESYRWEGLEDDQPDFVKRVKRFFKPSSFVIIKKTSLYQKLSASDLGYHQKIGEVEFRKQMLECSEAAKRQPLKL